MRPNLPNTETPPVTEEQVETPPETPPVVAAPAAPEPDRFADLQAQVAQLRDYMVTGMQALSQQRQQPEQPAMATGPSGEEIENAIAEGKGAAAIQALIDAKIAKATQDLQQNHIAPIGAMVQQHGVEAIAALAREQAAASVEPELKPYVERYAQEIRQASSTLAPELAMRPEHQKNAQYFVLGQHIKEIMADVRERAIRSARENPTGDAPGKAGRTKGAGDEPPTASDLFGKQAAKEVSEAGGEDAWAKRRGYESWPDFLLKTNAIEGNA